MPLDAADITEIFTPNEECEPPQKEDPTLTTITTGTSARASLTIEREIFPRLKTYNLSNFRELPQIQRLGEKVQFEMEVVANVLPFKTNNYVVDELINWDNVPNDPMFILTFPQRGMLTNEHYAEMEAALKTEDKDNIKATAHKIRSELNPHPAGQMELNVPTLKDGTKLQGMQHKYAETCLFFPSQSQTCHAYCSFCFRWPQFVGEKLKFAMKEVEQLVQYLREHPEISDVLFTGGDPMIMNAKVFSQYIDPLLKAELPNLRTIRIGTKSLSYWPYKFLDQNSDEMLDLFRKITDNGVNLSLMSHFNHPTELKTVAVQEAIKRILLTGAQIRTQSPILRNINDNPETWTEMWNRQVKLGCIPYYMFVVRDTGAQHYFGLPLTEAQEIFRDAYKKVSGLARTVRGPSMSANPGKIQILGAIDITKDQKALVLRFIQARNPEWVQKPFLAKYDESATWLDELQPLIGDRFFFEKD